MSLRAASVRAENFRRASAAANSVAGGGIAGYSGMVNVQFSVLNTEPSIEHWSSSIEHGGYSCLLNGG
ncbi:MAG: hypothetical protein LZF60_120128 [Nitrospira sp.]|nr:MAG: hypothetical protein LZF60_120128 [Nitrospira sp.]